MYLVDYLLQTIIEWFRRRIIERRGLILEWQNEKYEFRVGGYYNFVPYSIQLWLKLYATNTTNTPKILENIRSEIQGSIKWKINSGGIYSILDPYQKKENFLSLPVDIDDKKSKPLYILFIFQIPHDNPERFIEEIKIIKEPLVIKIFYKVKGEKEKILKMELNFKKEYIKVYQQFLSSFFEGQQIMNNNQNKILQKKLLEKLNDP